MVGGWARLADIAKLRSASPVSAEVLIWKARDIEGTLLSVGIILGKFGQLVPGVDMISDLNRDLGQQVAKALPPPGQWGVSGASPQVEFGGVGHGGGSVHFFGLLRGLYRLPIKRQYPSVGFTQ